MNKRISLHSAGPTQWLPVLVYSAWVWTFLWLLDKGRYRAFLHPKLWPLMVLGAIITFLFMASVFISIPSGDHIKNKSRFLIQGAFLILPLFFLWWAYGETLGTYAFSKRAQDLVADSTLLAKTLDTGSACALSMRNPLIQPDLSSLEPAGFQNDYPGKRPSPVNELDRDPLTNQPQSGARARDPFQPPPLEKIVDILEPEVEMKRRPSKDPSIEPYSSSAILVDYLPTIDKPLEAKGIDSAITLSGKGLPDKIRLFSEMCYYRFRLEDLQGTRFVTEGEVFHGKGVPEGFFLLFRWFISCCAADAEPLGIIVHSNAVENRKKSGWFRVEGPLEIQTIEGKNVPYIKAETVEMISTPPPEQRYLTY